METYLKFLIDFLKVNKQPEETMYHYFCSEQNNKELFDNLKRFTYNRPRDFLTYIKMEIEKIKSGKEIVKSFEKINVRFISDEFSDYIVGEMKNYASFYIEQKDFDKYLRFFDFVNGEINFSYQKYCIYFNKFKKTTEKYDDFNDVYMKSPMDLLQFFYDVGIVGYREKLSDGSGYHYYWSFRERTPNKLNPQVKGTDFIMINQGASKSLNVGKSFFS